ncbi:MAG TPA: galactose-1-phosphate uridylyltransferase [Syntrophomonadaceae bacterium]|nr:galactose-1-phosphate uridylyltransferase [Syntrophomonadaceae bacterium]
MAEIRKDLLRDTWIIIAKDRALKPNDFPINKEGVHFSGNDKVCPFCAGNEIHTPPEIAAYRDKLSRANSPGWTIRAIPNKYSAFSLQNELKIEHTGINQSRTGVGQHEVIIETPEHDSELHEFNTDKIELVFKMFQERYLALANDARIKYIQIYKNRGIFAGASLVHSHSQILALPMVPEVNKGLPKYYEMHSDCLICNIIAQEKALGSRVIYEGDEFIVLSPYASRFAYEIWVLPKKHQAHFGNITVNERQELAFIVKQVLGGIIAILGNPSYNIAINSAPINSGKEKAYHWFVEITPRLIVTAGVEVTTGLYMNPVSPEVATQIFKEEMAILLKE